MRIEKIVFQHFRGFETLEITFPEKGSAVLIGINGAGKSSILDGAALLLAKLIEKIAGIRTPQLQLKLSDIKDGFPETNLSICLSQPHSEQSLQWSLQKSFYRGRSDFSDVNTFVETFKKELLKNEEKGIPIIAYYKVDRNARAASGKSKAKKEVVVPQAEAYVNALGSALDYDVFIEWFIEQNNIENQIIKEQQDFNATNPKLSHIRRAINTFFAEFHEADYQNFRVGIKQNSQGDPIGEQAILVDKNGLELEFGQLSDGERSIILLVADIAYRLTIANPSNAEALHCPGIVLVDEIEQHLHPAWQRAVVFGLEATFPNVQFIFSTHSPQVLSNIQRENILILEDFALLENTPHTYGRDSNSILFDIFAVTKRPEHAQKEFDALYALMEEPEKIEDAKKMLDKMVLKYGSYDTEIVRAKTHLTFLESS